MMNATDHETGWLRVHPSGASYTTSFIDATHIAIIERHHGCPDRIIKTFTATDENCRVCESFCLYFRQHRQRLDANGARSIGMRIAKMRGVSNELQHP